MIECCVLLPKRPVCLSVVITCLHTKVRLMWKGSHWLWSIITPSAGWYSTGGGSGTGSVVTLDHTYILSVSVSVVFCQVLSWLLSTQVPPVAVHSTVNITYFCFNCFQSQEIIILFCLLEN